MMDKYDSKAQLRELLHLDPNSVPTTEAPTFPNLGVSLEFLISILKSNDMMTPMHLLAGISRDEMIVKDLPELRNLCKELRVLADSDTSDELEFQIYSGQVSKPRMFFINALRQLPTTMAHVNFCIVKPRTKKRGGSYAEKILKHTHPEWVGTPTDFCSHTWKSSFRDFVMSLQHEAAQRGPSATPRFYWTDVFVENQNTSETKPKDYFYSAFRDAVSGIGRTLLVMGSLANAKPLTRAWCIWEIFCTIAASGAELVVVMPPSAQLELEQMLRFNPKDIIQLVKDVKTEQSEGFHDYDRKEIHRIIREQCKGGFEGVNREIREELRGWLSSMSNVVDETASKMMSEQCEPVAGFQGANQAIRERLPGWMSSMSKVVDEAVSKLPTKVKNDETTLLKRMIEVVEVSTLLACVDLFHMGAYRVEPSGCSQQCTGKCKEMIKPGQLRFGSLGDFKGHPMYYWRCLNCCTPRQLSNVLSKCGSLENVEQFDTSLTKGQQKRFIKAFQPKSSTKTKPKVSKKKQTSLARKATKKKPKVKTKVTR
jgi:hypothetical protein